MIGQGNNPSFRAVNPGHSHGRRPLGQLFEDHVETIFNDIDDDLASNHHGLHINQRYANNFIFNYPGQYSISLSNDVSFGHLQTQAGMLTRNVPTSNGVNPTTSAANYAMFGASAAAGTSAKNQGGSSPATTSRSGNGNEPTLSSIERPPLSRVSSSVTFNGERTY